MDSFLSQGVSVYFNKNIELKLTLSVNNNRNFAVNIYFKSKKLARLANNQKKLVKAYGSVCAKKITQRLGDMRAAATLEDLRNVPGRFHELKGDRKGQWACDAKQPYRIIFTSYNNPIPRNEQNQYVWNEITEVEIIEIIDYH